MKARAGSIVLLGVALGFASAHQGSPYELALQSAIDSLEKVGVTLKTIVDEESAGAAKLELRKSATAFLDAKAKAEKLQPPEKAEKLRLEKLYKPKLDEAVKKMNIESRRVELIPGGRDVVKELSALLKKDKKPAK